jgi:hypothetical protein
MHAPLTGTDLSSYVVKKQGASKKKKGSHKNVKLTMRKITYWMRIKNIDEKLV